MNQNKNQLLTGILLTLAMLAVVFISLRLNTPPEAVPEDAPAGEFSAERAWKHLETIASVKNPIGSAENVVVREYIVDELRQLGLEPELQSTTYYDSRLQRIARLGNIMARIPGTGSGRAILFMGHYDTVPDAYGASDNGSAVATLLELIRMLQHHPPLKNDLIFFFPDGEEVGLLGAKAFLNEHPWAEDINLVVNLEARGTSGQSFMFETGYHNLKTISAFAESVPDPVANSISYEIYTRMPNDTDFSPFKQLGHQGLNIAYIENAFDYHTAGDNPENTDIRSLQHHGSYTQAIALELGNMKLQLDAEENAVYFNTIGYGFTYYPYSWTVPIAVVVVILFAVMLLGGIRKQNLRPVKWLYGLAAFAIYLFLLYTVVFSLYHFISGYYPGSAHLLLEYNQNRLIPGFAFLALSFSLLFYRMLYNGVCLTHALLLLLGVAFLLLISGEMSLLTGGVSFLACAALFFLFNKPASSYDLGVGALLLWVVLMVYTAIFIPGASYLLTWPLAAAILGYFLIFITSDKKYNNWLTAVILFLAAIPALVWYPFFGNFFLIAMGLPASATASILLGLMIGILIPQMEIVTRVKSWLLPGIFFLAGAVLLAAGSISLDYDERHRKPVNIQFVYQADTGISKWISSDREVNTWTRQFLTSNPDTTGITGFSPLVTQQHLASPAIYERELPAPEARLMHDTITNGERMLSWQVSMGRPAARLGIYLRTKSPDLDISIDGAARHKLQPRRNTSWHPLLYFAPPEDGFELTIYADPTEEIELRLTDVCFGLPEFTDALAMPPHMMPQGHQSLATRSYQLSPKVESER